MTPALERWYAQELEGVEARRDAFVEWRQKHRYPKPATTEEIIWIASGGRSGKKPEPEPDEA